MKPQQRKFIVEVKSARRRSMIRPSSIWGDTDLKALVREVETDAPHLFEPTADQKELSPGPGAELFANQDTATDLALSSDLAIHTQENVGTEVASGSALLLPLEAGLSNTVSLKRSKHQVSRRGNRRVSKATMAAEEATCEELVALEEENRRLKGLLAQRLQQENIQLQKMLNRFATS